MMNVSEIPEVDTVESLALQAKADTVKVDAQLARAEVWNTASSDLAELERRVGEKWVAAVAVRLPEFELLDLGGWADSASLSFPVTVGPQFPRETWASYPAKRTVTLLLCEKLLDNAAELTDEQWITLCLAMQYGGKTRLS